MNSILAYWDKEDRAGKIRLAGCGSIAAFLTFVMIFTFCGNGFSLSRLIPPRIPSPVGLNNLTITATISPTSTIPIETLTAERGLLTSTPVLTGTATATPRFTPTKTATRPASTATLAPPTPTRTSAPAPTSTATVAPYPPTPVGANVSCSQIGNTQICAWVSNATPQSSSETVFGRLVVNGVPQANQMMNATWDFKPSTVECSAMTGSNGVASCSHGTGHATAGVTVRIVVTINGFTATTSFTP